MLSDVLKANNFAVPNATPSSVFTSDSQHQENPSSAEPTIAPFSPRRGVQPAMPVFTAIKAFLQGNGGWANCDVRKGINSRDRDFFGEAVAALVAAGEVTDEKEDRAKVLVLVEGRR